MSRSILMAWTVAAALAAATCSDSKSSVEMPTRPGDLTTLSRASPSPSPSPTPTPTPTPGAAGSGSE